MSRPHASFAHPRPVPPGAPDTTFGGGDGIVITSLAGEFRPLAMAVQADGNILVAGRARPTGQTNYDYALVRLVGGDGAAAGDLDTVWLAVIFG